MSLTNQCDAVKRYLAEHSHASRLQLVGPLGTSQTILAEPIIFIDGGSRLRARDEGVAVGDGDSFDGFLDHRLDPDKDYSDLAYVLGHIGPEFSEIELCGFLGGRRDHELLNFGEVHHFLSVRRSPAHVRFDQQVEAFSAGQWQFDSQGIFSLVLFSRCHVALEGDCRYSVLPESSMTPLSSLGLSNVGFGQVQLKADGPVFIFHHLTGPL